MLVQSALIPSHTEANGYIFFVAGVLYVKIYNTLLILLSQSLKAGCRRSRAQRHLFLMAYGSISQKEMGFYCYCHHFWQELGFIGYLHHYHIHTQFLVIDCLNQVIYRHQCTCLCLAFLSLPFILTSPRT